jgi:hypothetical protein
VTRKLSSFVAFFLISVKIAKAILELNLLPKLDIGKLTYEYGLEEDKYPDAKYFVISNCAKTQRKFNRKMLYCMVWTHWSFISQR